MAKGDSCKIRLIAVYRMVSSCEKISARQIQRRLEDHYGITADRKTIYSDIAAIDRFIPLMVVPGKNGGYSKYNFEEDELL